MRGAVSDWLSILFAILAFGAGLAIALAVQKFGVITLLLIPAIGLFIISMVYPEVGLLTLVFVTYTQLSNVLIKFHSLPSIAQPLVALMLVVIVIRLAVVGDHAQGWLSAAVRLGIYGFVILLSVLAAKSVQTANVEFVDYVKDALVAITMVFLVQSPSRFKRTLWILIIAGGVMGSISAFQHLTGTYSNTYWGFGGWITEVARQTTNQRVTGPYSNPNAFSQVLIVVAALALDRMWNERRVGLRVLAGWAIIACGLGILFSYSRGGLLSLIFTLALIIVERRPNVFPVVLTGAIGLLLLQFLPATYTSRVATLQELIPFDSTQLTTQSYRGRLSENLASWYMFRDNPVLGVGPANFSAQYQKYSRQFGLDPRSTARSPASLYGEIIAEQGMLGMMVFVLLMWSVHTGLRRANQLFLAAQNIDQAHLATALWVGLAGYLFAAITKNSAYSNVFWMLIGLGMAALNVAVNTYQAYRKQEENQHSQQGAPA